MDCFSEDAVLAVFMGQEPIKGKAAIKDAFMNQIAKSDKHVGREANLPPFRPFCFDCSQLSRRFLPSVSIDSPAATKKAARIT